MKFNFRKTENGTQWPLPFKGDLKLNPYISFSSWLLAIVLIWPLLIDFYLGKFIWKKVDSPKLKYGLVGSLVLLAIFVNVGWAAGIIHPTSSNQLTSSEKSSQKATTQTTKNNKTASSSAGKTTENPDLTSEDENSHVHTNAPATPAKVTSNTTCDNSLWSHIYHSSRLTIVDNCKTVRGVVDVIRKEADGDYHILLKLDSQYASTGTP